MKITYSNDTPSFERSCCVFGVIWSNFDVCIEDASKLERFRIEEFFCLKLKLEPSKRTELDVYSSIFDRFKSTENMSFSLSAIGFRKKQIERKSN